MTQKSTLSSTPGGILDLHDIRSQQVAMAVQELLERHHGDKLLLVPEGFELQSTERFQDQRQRLAANFSFADLPEWAAYIQAQPLQENQAICMIDHESMAARATLDHGNAEKPLHGSHKATLKLEKTPEYAALLKISGDRLKQKQLAEWIEDWAHCISGESTEAEAMDAKQLAMSVRKITIDASRSSDHETSDFGSNRSTLEKIEARNKERMPAWIFFTTKPYDDLGERTFRMRVSVIASAEEPTLVLRIVGLETEQRSMAAEFKKLVKEALKEAPVSVYVGQ